MKEQIKTFAGLEENSDSYAGAEVVILPVPYEKTTTYIKGTKFGPQALLNASPNLEFYDDELETIPLDDIRIATLAPLETEAPPETMTKEVAKSIDRIVRDGKIPFMLGGEHSVTIGAFQGVKDSFKNISVVQFDAHADLRDSYEGSPFNHACVMRRIHNNAHLCQIGLRAIDKEEAVFIKEHDLDVFFARDIVGKADWHERALQNLKENVYITFDLDAFDCSLIPATGTPEPGGLFWYDVLLFLKKLIFQKNIIGMDIVELSPLKDLHAPDFTAAKLLYKMIGYLSFKKTLNISNSSLK